jgi:hypothetical protein
MSRKSMKPAVIALVIIVVATGIAAAAAMIGGMRYWQGIALMVFSAIGWAVQVMWVYPRLKRAL